MNDPQPLSPRRRLQMLLAIPDNQKTEAEWDEINELEITLAPGNRIDPRDESRRFDPLPTGNSKAQGGRPGGGHQKPAGAGGGGQTRKPFRKFKKKPTPPEASG
mgnify:CR=1 FL=1